MSLPQSYHGPDLKSLQAFLCPEKPDSLTRHAVMSCLIGLALAVILIAMVDREVSKQLTPSDPLAYQIVAAADDNAGRAQALALIHRVGR